MSHGTVVRIAQFAESDLSTFFLETRAGDGGNSLFIPARLDDTAAKWPKAGPLSGFAKEKACVTLLGKHPRENFYHGSQQIYHQ